MAFPLKISSKGNLHVSGSAAVLANINQWDLRKALLKTHSVAKHEIASNIHFNYLLI